MVLRCTGGRKQLCELVDEFGGELRGDFQQFYGLDLADAWRGKLTSRRALDLAEQLFAVPGSRYRAAASYEPQLLGWDANSEILASIYDGLVDNSVITIKVAGGKSRPAQPYPRPEPKSAPIKAPTIADFPIFAVARMTS